MGPLGVPYGDMVSKKAPLRHTHTLTDSLGQEGGQVAPAEFRGVCWVPALCTAPVQVGSGECVQSSPQGGGDGRV